jgi:TatD DNase family protein
MPLFDTHAHLTSDQIADSIDQVLNRAREAAVVGMTAIGTGVESSKACLQLAHQHKDVWASVGIHPNDCKESTESDWQQVVSLASDQRVVAIGETGLDRYWDDCPIEIQRKWFARHIDLSFETKKPLVIHMRECEPDILDMLQKHAQDGQIIGIMHSFAGCQDTADQCLAMGMYISFAGMVTFKKSDDLRSVAATIPEDRLLIETDSPYLSPHPKRSQRPNEPALVEHTARCLAEVRGITLAELGNQTTRNAKRVFGLTGSSNGMVTHQ